jgi:hypothetical protein
MIRYLISLFCIIVFLVSCSGNPKVPNGVLPPDKMRSVMWDMIQADEFVSYKAFTDSSYKSLNKRTQLYQQVFRLHHTSREEFKKSIQYYQGHPEMLKTMFDSLQAHSDRNLHSDSARKLPQNNKVHGRQPLP